MSEFFNVTIDDTSNKLGILERFSSTRTYLYDSLGNISRESVSGDLTYSVIYKYDANENIIREDYYDASSEIIGTKHYTYDDEENIIAVVSVHADILSVVSNSDLTEKMSERISILETSGTGNGSCRGYNKTVTIKVNDNQTEIFTGIRLDNVGSRTTHYMDLIFTVNGFEMSHGIDYITKNENNEIVVTWLDKDFILESSDDIAITYNHTDTDKI